MPKSVLDEPRFRNEESAYEWVEARVWANGRFCPHCGVIGESGKLKGKSTRIGVYKCYACRKPFTVKVGTIFEKSHVPMHIWMQAIHLVCSSKKGISANQLHRVLGVDLKTAWFMGHRIRLAMDPGSNAGPLGGEGKVIEADETFVIKQRGRTKWEFNNTYGWMKVRDRRELVVFALVERGGRARAMPIAATTSDELRRALKKHGDTKSALMTDEWRGYIRPGREFASHESVNHSEEEWTRWDRGSMAGTEAVENFFSVFKRGMKGVYQHCSEEHLARYLHEFAFRYSNRIGLGVDDVERSARTVAGAVGKRLTYRTTHRETGQTGTA